ncbi:BSD domain containing protein [Fagus crenata]
MSWLARSIANSLKLDDEEEDEHTNPNADATDPKSPQKSIPEADQHHHQPDSPSSPSNQSPRGVKEDLSEITKTLTRQLWGVASFLAPPPEPSSSAPPRQIPDSNPSQPSDQPDDEASEEDVISGIRSDFAEISGRFKTGISKLSSTKTVSEITKIASNFLQLGSEEIDIGDAIGVTEEVVTFARNIAMHPETWLDFPLPHDEDSDEFELSDAQQEHALAIEQLVPRLSALRIELSPGYMSEACFWKIYFVLVHPRLNKHDAELLSTPQIVDTRTMLTQELQNRNKAKQEPEYSGRSTNYSYETANLPREQNLSVLPSAQSELAPLQVSAVEVAPSSVPADIEMEKHPVQSTELQIVDKPVVEEGPVNQTKNQPSRVLDEKFEDDGDDWLKEESSEMVSVSGTSFPMGNDEDVSFSDLEDDDDGDLPTSYKKVTSGSDSSTKDSRDWVQLSRTSTDSVKDINSVEIQHAGSEQVSSRNHETKESNDWLDVDDIDAI